MYETVALRLQALRAEMKKAGVQAYIIPTSDFHDTEYVAEYFSARKYMSGFTGSQGTLVVLMDQAALWTDGRYFIQAARELEGSGIALMKMGEPGTPSVEVYIADHLTKGDCVGFDGRTVSATLARKYKNFFDLHGISINPHMDLVSGIWPDRPPMQATPTFHYDEKYAGKSVADKLAQVRAAMQEAGARHHIMTKVDETAWLYNLRARDIPHFPVALCYTILSDDGAVLYIDDSRLDEESRRILAENHVELKDYDAIYKDVAKLEGSVLLNPDYVNSALVFSLPAENLVEAADPVVKLKAIKNDVELENTRNAHIKDGVAVTKFMHWLKTRIGQEDMSEIIAQDYLQQLRKEQPLYLEDSFNTISAYKDHAAMMHYSSSKETDIPLKAEGMLLVDSGGHYLDGTTDITRTFVLGDLTDEERYWFTKALQSHIDLARAKFLYGCTGVALDVLAREPLWKESMDYQCGTGHGVGHLLSVHEAPNGFRWRIVPERNDSAVLEAGMIQSNEPGVYEEGKFGIRHENEMLIVKADANKYGQFMEMEPLTFVPFDLDGLDISLLSKEQKAWLNDYHAQVYTLIAPHLNESEAAWLAQATREVE